MTAKKTNKDEAPEKKKKTTAKKEEDNKTAKKASLKKAAPKAEKPASKKAAPAAKKTKKADTSSKAEPETDEEDDGAKRKFIYTPPSQVVKKAEEEPKEEVKKAEPQKKEVQTSLNMTFKEEPKPVAQPKPAPAPVQKTEPAAEPLAKPAPAPEAPKPVQQLRPEVKPAPRPESRPAQQPAQPEKKPDIRPIEVKNSSWQAPGQKGGQKPWQQVQRPQYNPPQKQQPKHKQKQKAAQQGPACNPEDLKTAQDALKIIKIVGQPTVKELAEKMEIKINDFIKKLMGLGIFATINQRLEKDMIELVIAECGFKAEMAEEFSQDAIGGFAQVEDKADDLKPRAPVVTIMGHVDHGKTSLLDAIRESNVIDTEHGAITQHIGAYRVKTSRGDITFLDTPGHEAFTAMRARGAQATDIVILVVSATDGIMPQTLEAIDHAKAAGAPIIVAVNKIDLPGANPDKIKQDLAARGLVPEEWQGNTIFVEISAKKRINIEGLLEMVSLQAEMLDLKANPNRAGIGVILESKKDNKRGVLATVLVQKGTIKIGDPFIVGTAAGRVRALIDENGRRLHSIGPSVPAEVLGITGEPPHVGETFYIAPSEKEAKDIADKRAQAQKADSFAHKKHVSLMNLKNSDGGAVVKKLALILKADVQGSIEAIKDALLRIPSDEVEVSIVHSGAGNINTGDILLAKASEAVIIGFNIDASDDVKAEAEKEGIEIRIYNIIFELLEDIRAAMEGLLEPDIVEVETGRATVRQVFNLSSGIVAGSYIDSGKMTRGSEARVIRGGETVWTGKIGGLKRFKDDVKEVEKGFECGILLDGFKQVKEGDTVVTFRKDTVTRRISAK
ncbi:translation initiation factor IF-2 [Parelusimicrobium proximum]|uniref:translation initiation factor IF-2 n=1 Tax=Parelusimicrobium proximum TaxID=3228953 RepID=UPI003D183153